MFNVEPEQLLILQEKLSRTMEQVRLLAMESEAKIRITQSMLDGAYEQAYFREQSLGNQIDEINNQINNIKYNSSDDDDNSDMLDSLYSQLRSAQDDYADAMYATKAAQRRKESFSVEASIHRQKQENITASYKATIDKSAIFLDKYRTLVLKSKEVITKQNVSPVSGVPDSLPEVNTEIKTIEIDNSGVIDVYNEYRDNADIEIGTRRYSANDIDGVTSDGSSKSMKLDIQMSAYKDFTPEQRLENLSSQDMLPNINGEVTGGDSTKLGKNMFELMGMPRNSSRKGYEAQHIIPKEKDIRNHPVIQKIGMDLDHPSNGIFLRNAKQGKANSVMSIHQGGHDVYNKFVLKKLDEIDVNKDITELRIDVFELQCKLLKLIKSGLPLYKDKERGASIELWQKWFEKI